MCKSILVVGRALFIPDNSVFPSQFSNLHSQTQRWIQGVWNQPVLSCFIEMSVEAELFIGERCGLVIGERCGLFKKPGKVGGWVLRHCIINSHQNISLNKWRDWSCHFECCFGRKPGHWARVMKKNSCYTWTNIQWRVL